MEENDEEGDFYFGEKEKKRKIKDEMNIRFLSKYSEDLFFAKDINDIIRIYKFKDKSFELYQNFPNITTKKIKGMIKLKNNNLIMYSYGNIFVIKNY